MICPRHRAPDPYPASPAFGQEHISVRGRAHRAGHVEPGRPDLHGKPGRHLRRGPGRTGHHPRPSACRLGWGRRRQIRRRDVVRRAGCVTSPIAIRSHTWWYRLRQGRAGQKQEDHHMPHEFTLSRTGTVATAPAER
jgi:hypothetical protein